MLTVLCLVIGIAGQRYFQGFRPLQVWALGTLLLLGFALFVRIRYKYSGLGYGIILAILLMLVGIFLLAIALCGGGTKR